MSSWARSAIATQRAATPRDGRRGQHPSTARAIPPAPLRQPSESAVGGNQRPARTGQRSGPIRSHRRKRKRTTRRPRSRTWSQSASSRAVPMPSRRNPGSTRTATKPRPANAERRAIPQPTTTPRRGAGACRPREPAFPQGWSARSERPPSSLPPKPRDPRPRKHDALAAPPASAARKPVALDERAQDDRLPTLRRSESCGVIREHWCSPCSGRCARAFGRVALRRQPSSCYAAGMRVEQVGQAQAAVIFQRPAPSSAVDCPLACSAEPPEPRHSICRSRPEG
jgi:hypothetical protein